MQSDDLKAKSERPEIVTIKGLEHRLTTIKLVPKRGTRLTVSKRPPDKK